jgi:hypothetical protein
MNYDKLSIEQLNILISTKQEEYNSLINEPKTRVSAYGGIMIHEIRTITKYEALYEEIDLIKAEITKRTNKDGDKLFFILYDNRVIELLTSNGIVKKGGLLENYFVGKSASEHASYVSDRHDKQLTEVKFLEEKITDNKIHLILALNGRETFKLSCEYKITNDNPTYFYIEFLHKSIFDYQLNKELTQKHRRKLCTYAGAYLYKKTFAPEKNINIRSL